MNFILPKRARAPSRRSGTKLENTSLSTDVNVIKLGKNKNLLARESIIF